MGHTHKKACSSTPVPYHTAVQAYDAQRAGRSLYLKTQHTHRLYCCYCFHTSCTHGLLQKPGLQHKPTITQMSLSVAVCHVVDAAREILKEKDARSATLGWIVSKCLELTDISQEV
jgi:hypothetical protein